jgi:hypothetical protein
MAVCIDVRACPARFEPIVTQLDKQRALAVPWLEKGVGLGSRISVQSREGTFLRRRCPSGVIGMLVLLFGIFDALRLL